MQETQVQYLGQEVSLEKETVTHSSILAWEIPWTEKPSRLQSWGCKHQIQLNNVTMQLRSAHDFSKVPNSIS